MIDLYAFVNDISILGIIMRLLTRLVGPWVMIGLMTIGLHLIGLIILLKGF